ncbi:MAG: methylated-DNA--[protein]-cysteine S-methyltransferase [Candidatus Latescibacterota bacterium]|nr:methylated-DNA--[protein]-cysteine S-methyltransferase [Candidatus Latescibacterota bacterium]
MSGCDFAFLTSPLGKLFVAWKEALEFVRFTEGRWATPPQDWRQVDSQLPFDLEGQFQAYFAGELREFNLPLSPQGTVFQRRVWSELRKIPYGQTCSYGELARRIGKPGAARAVGSANHYNPLPVVVPCHRVIGSRGQLTGYAGGVQVKRFLLELEAEGQPLP